MFSTAGVRFVFPVPRDCVECRRSRVTAAHLRAGLAHSRFTAATPSRTACRFCSPAPRGGNGVICHCRREGRLPARAVITARLRRRRRSHPPRRRCWCRTLSRAQKRGAFGPPIRLIPKPSCQNLSTLCSAVSFSLWLLASKDAAISQRGHCSILLLLL